MRILVVGAGIAGLSTARMLAVDGQAVVLAERAPALRTAGAGLLLHRRAVRALGAAGFDVAGLGTPLDSMSITTPAGAARGAVTGRTCFARPELLEALHRGVREVAEVRLGQLVSFPASTSAHEQGARHVDCTVGGRQERFDAVVGADGISSRTRAAVQPGVRVSSTGQVCWRGIVAMATGTRGTEMWSGSVRVGTVPLSRDRTYAYVVTTGRAPGDGDLVHLVGSDSLPPREQRATSLLLALPTSTRSRLELRELQHPVWGRGRIALVGDAAHAITPDLGLGAALAIDDATSLTRALRDPDRAVGRYRRQRHLTVRSTQLASRQLGRLAHSPAPAARVLRAAVGARPR
ncbi:MAG: FAD-dependent monooxygenase [Quadrisphaera sp.]